MLLSRTIQLVYLFIVMNVVIMIVTFGLLSQNVCHVNHLVNTSCYRYHDQFYRVDMFSVNNNTFAVFGCESSPYTCDLPCLFTFNRTYWCNIESRVNTLSYEPSGLSLFTLFIETSVMLSLISFAIYTHCTTPTNNDLLY